MELRAAAWSLAVGSSVSRVTRAFVRVDCGQGACLPWESHGSERAVELAPPITASSVWSTVRGEAAAAVLDSVPESTLMLPRVLVLFCLVGKICYLVFLKKK